VQPGPCLLRELLALFAMRRCGTLLGSVPFMIARIVRQDILANTQRLKEEGRASVDVDCESRWSFVVGP